MKRARSSPRALGAIYDGTGCQVADTVMCVHCGRHWIWRQGSGKRRGFCMNCMGITCGNQKCVECLPIEKRMTLFETGKRKSL